MTLKIVGSLLALGILGGCAVGPRYSRPALQTEVPDQWAAPAAMAESMVGSRTDTLDTSHQNWWEDFGDTTLNNLVESALVHNNDLAAAVGRVLESEALLGGSRAGQWPTLEVGGNATRTKRTEVGGVSFMPLHSNSFAANATVRYEADLWGRLSRGKQAALATALASEQDRRTLAQSLIANVVRTWLEIRELRLQVQLSEQTVRNYQISLETVLRRYRQGLVTALDVHLARQNLAAAQAQIPARRRQLAAARRRLEILAGRYPSGTIAEEDSIRMPDPLPPVPAGLPSDLLLRRPDLIAAELRLQAGVERVGEAKAALYPRISLTGSAGTSSNELSGLFTAPSDIWSLAGNLVLPLINRGAVKSRLKAAEARVLQSTSQYRGTVLKAFSEVENALDEDRYQQEQENFLTQSVAQARRSVDLAEDRYRRGLDNILVTLDSQRRLFNAESQLLTTQRLRRAARVNLILALGGPWEEVQTQRNQGDEQ